MFRRLAPQHDILVVILRDASPEESLRCFAPLNMTGQILRRFTPQNDIF